jgi:hypothetical protein
MIRWFLSRTAAEKVQMEGLVEKENLDCVAATMHLLFCEIYKGSP